MQMKGNSVKPWHCIPH